ncbi:MAG: ACT domain-containing protein [Vicinamibacteria bacterium]|nr:ACT domain-containing protein [Vicinamibacteria bacterium]
MTLNVRAREVWSTAQTKVWPEALVLATFPRFVGDRVAAFAGRVGVRDASAFVAFLTEGTECTLSAPEAAFNAWRLRARATEIVTGLRAITIEATMPVDLVGFFAPVADRLAVARIPIIPQCGFRTDHILVPQSRLDDAVRVIEGLISDARKESL